jgi:hypothetical protein
LFLEIANGNPERRKFDMFRGADYHPPRRLPGRFGGGIAQLVERQLCKLEVRGSNPLASKLKAPGQNATKGEHYRMH